MNDEELRIVVIEPIALSCTVIVPGLTIANWERPVLFHKIHNNFGVVPGVTVKVPLPEEAKEATVNKLYEEVRLIKFHVMRKGILLRCSLNEDIPKCLKLLISRTFPIALDSFLKSPSNSM